MSKAPAFFVDHTDTPLGQLTIVADDRGCLRVVGWTDGRPMRRRLRARAEDWSLEPASDPGGFTSAIRAYFRGDWSAIDTLPVTLAGTPFQNAVWLALRTVACGETRSYGDIARHIGSPTAFRAVGLAIGANPVGIVVPCHRVIGADGSLTGYGGGIERKRWLLSHERPGHGAELAFGPSDRSSSRPLDGCEPLAGESCRETRQGVRAHRNPMPTSR